VPSARMTLMKMVDSRGFVFATHYDGRKAKDIDENPHAAVVFYWQSLQRSVRIEGRIEKTSKEDSDEIWNNRPRESRLMSLASKQSRPFPTLAREELEVMRDEVLKKFEGVEHIPRPGTWGGYRIIPISMEFWQNGKFRLHDRIRYRRENENSSEWTRERLYP